jgi:radical SAM protein with 4Fe4S-binding SPASM domain
MEREDIAEVVAKAHERGLRPSITPSATALVTYQRLAELKSAGLVSCAFSLDGSSAQVHDRFRGIRGTFDLTMKKIHDLHQLRIPLQINTTVSLYNRDDLLLLSRKVEELEAFRWSVFFLIPVGRAKSRDMLGPREQEEVLEWLWQIQQQVPYEIKTTEAPQYRRIQNQQGLPLSKSAVWDGNGFVFIAHNGDIYPSGFLPLAAGNVRTDSLIDVYRNNPLFQGLRHPDSFYGKCGYCEFNTVCAGSRARAYAITGNPLESDPFCPYIPDPRRDTSDKNKISTKTKVIP